MTSQTHATQKVKIVKKNRDMNEISNGANTVLNIVFIIAVLVTVIPIWVIIIASFTSEKALTTYGYGFWPQEWSVEAYKFLFSKGSIIGTAYRNTIIATVVGTVLCVATRSPARTSAGAGCSPSSPSSRSCSRPVPLPST